MWPIIDLSQILTLGIRYGASDVHLKAGLPPMFRVDGVLRSVKDTKALSARGLEEMAMTIMSSLNRSQFEEQLQVDFSHAVEGLGRFRINVYRQREQVGLCARVIASSVPSISELQLPAVLEEIAADRRGLILVTGATGSGKSTTLAAMVDHINSTRTTHIMTIEDPIEYLHEDKRSVVNQREIGTDTHSFEDGLLAALRQDPDVILIGEMRTASTIETVLTAGATGHLVLSTVHALDVVQTINRIVNAFPPHRQRDVRHLLAGVLTAVVSQRLLPRSGKKGRVAALEILRMTGRVREMIVDPGRTVELREALASGAKTYGMQTFDQALMGLFRAGLVSYDDALKECQNPDDFALRVGGISSARGEHWSDFEGSDAAGGGDEMEIER